ncbi:MAG TPA: hypothetical protein VL422_12600 [Miltoncostaea sp.]|nr:hypothetical protein [Miltoncostaea sp.]
MLFAALGWLRGVTGTAQYASTAQVVVKGFDNLSSQLDSSGAGLQDPNKTVATLRRLVTVDEITDNVARDVGLPESAARDIRDRTGVETQVDSDLIGITVTWPDRLLSERIAQATAEEFVRYRARLDTAPLLAAQRDIGARIDALGGDSGNALVQQLQNAEIDLRTRIAIGSHNSEVASRASDPEQVAPSPKKTAALFGIAALAVSLFVVAALQAADSRIRSDEDAARALGTVALATLPRPRPAAAREAVVMIDDPGAAAAEPFRVLATNLRLNGAGRERRTIMVAPAVPDAAAATLNANVAAAAARSGRLVALCDLDFRRPQLGGVFGLQHALGAGDVLSGVANLDDALHPIPLGDEPQRPRPRVRRRGSDETEHVVGRTSGLWVVPVGDVVGTPADLAGSVAMADLIASLRTRFEIVLLQVPPWSVAGDALSIGQHVDAVLPVVPAGIQRGSLVAMRKGLQQLRVHVIGMAYHEPRPTGGAQYTESAYGPLTTPEPEPEPDGVRAPAPRENRLSRGWGRG